jgi:hypothetical protein
LLLGIAPAEQQLYSKHKKRTHAMKAKLVLLCVLTLVCASLGSDLASAQATDPLGSWNEGKTKQSILEFVKKVTTPGSPDFVPPAATVLGEKPRELSPGPGAATASPVSARVEFPRRRLHSGELIRT